MNTSLPAIAARRQALIYVPQNNRVIRKFTDALVALACRILIEANGKALDTGRFIAALDHLIDAKVFMTNALKGLSVGGFNTLWHSLPSIDLLKKTEVFDTDLGNILDPSRCEFVKCMCRIFRDFNKQTDKINFGETAVRDTVFEQVVNHLLMAHTCFTMAAIIGQATSVVDTNTAVVTSAITSTPQPVFEKTDSPKKRARGEAQLDLSSPKKDTMMLTSFLTSLTKEQNEIAKEMAENDDDDLEE